MTDLLPFDVVPAPEPGRARHRDPETSHEAAKSVDATALEQAVLDALQHYGPSTTEQLAFRMQLKLVSVSPRMKPLLDKGRIHRHGRAPNLSGRSAIVWALIAPAP